MRVGNRVLASMLPDDDVVASAFLPVAEVRLLRLSPAERLFLDAAAP